MSRSAPAPRAWPARSAGTFRGLLAALLLAALLAPPSPAQEGQGKSQEQLVQELLDALARERAARQALEARVAALEAGQPAPTSDDLEAQLAALVAPGDLQRAPQRVPTPPSFYNPTIGVFMDSRIDAGNFDTRLDEDTDDFSLRETELDFRVPISPWAQGVAIIALENEGGEFETVVEEGYADIQLGAMFGRELDTNLRLGRFRPMFGRNNQLHLHDWLQVNLPLPMRNLVGEEGLIGEGFAIRQPVAAWTGPLGSGQATNLDLAVVNGDMLAGHGTPLDPLAEDAGTELESDGPLLVARLSHYAELDTVSDIELGVSRIARLGEDSVSTESGTDLEVGYWDVDLTWRQRDSEHMVGSWLVQAETVRAAFDDEGAGITGETRESGWWLTLQRQMSMNVFLGLLYGESDVLASDAEQTSISPYVSWYPDEFFRIRAQIEHLTQDGNGTADDFSDANRFLLQFTWNFGAHQPHPYWVNR